MRVDYFADLIVPGVPVSTVPSGDSSKPAVMGMSPLSPLPPEKNINTKGTLFPARCSDFSTTAADRSWTPGNPFICSCGRTTGWQRPGKTLCPACVPPGDPEQYRKEMLAWADELEAFAQKTDDTEMRRARMSVVYAIREELLY